MGEPLRASQHDYRRAIALFEQLIDRARPDDGDAPHQTLSDVYDGWLKARAARGLRNVPNERTQLELHILPKLGAMPLGEIRVRHVRDCIDGLRGGYLAPRSVRSIYGTLHKLFADLVVDEVVPASPCVLTKDQLPAVRDKDPEWRANAIFTRGEIELIISAPVLPIDRRVIYAIKFFTGGRIGEVFGLRFRDYDRKAAPLGRLTIAHSYDKLTKTEVPRPVPVHPVLARILTEWERTGFLLMFGRAPTPDDLIVPSRRGRIRSRHRHRNKFLEDLQLLGLRPRRVHDTRRTFITLARVDGAPRDVLQHITHAPKRGIMDIYTTLPWPMICDAVSCLRLRLLRSEEIPRRLRAVWAADQRSNGKRQDPAT